MDIGIGLPATIPGVKGKQVTEWAKKADEAGFSTLGTIDRVVYPNYEPFIALAAAAAVTERIRLTTAIAILPFRESATMIAKQAATIHELSGGRFVLGAAVGMREDDYEAAGSDYHTRGKRFEQMLIDIERTWQEGDVGPKLESPPPLLIGGRVDAAFERAARYGAGWIMGGGTPDQLAEGKEKTEAAWKEAGRDSEPRIACLAYYALGDDAQGHADRYLKDYYGYLGEEGAGQVASSGATDDETVKQYIQGFEEAGADEFILFPCNPDPGQVDLLAEVAL
jgi:alkanesulfonate monooxygenase SsuD/methylene tetrahydromethanopterin reductase-like flavin-dependent oxidoreductase (luciferase family)